jgi:hypothetical protein
LWFFIKLKKFGRKRPENLEANGQRDFAQRFPQAIFFCASSAASPGKLANAMGYNPNTHEKRSKRNRAKSVMPPKFQWRFAAKCFTLPAKIHERYHFGAAIGRARRKHGHGRIIFAGV